MGLDLSVMLKKDYDALYVDRTMSWSEDIDLAYGRKTWAIKWFFESRATKVLDEGLTLIPESAWDEFYKVVAPYVVDITDAVDTIYDYEYGTSDDDEAAAKAYRVVDEIMDKIYDANDIYQLGADWEARATLRWFEAYDKIKAAYAAGEEIVMVASW